MVLGFGDPTKGMTRIWGHFVILVGCERVILRPQIMLIYSVVVYKMPVIHLLSIKVVAHINCCFFQRMQITNIMYFFPYKPKKLIENYNVFT